MGIPEDLKNNINHGDWEILTKLYNQTHEKTVTASYILKVVKGKTSARTGTAAAEILVLAEKYLSNKKDFIEKIISKQ